ncbi:MAG: hypothetical protein HYU67_02735 [Flavobacteriia bacterium]|nr:hypothetical protein [Flavobacteriia bacterium]
MELICLKKISAYTTPNNRKDFIKVSLKLFLNELNNFEESLNNYHLEKNELLLKQAIHKIKPNFELFVNEREIIDNLIYTYNLNFDLKYYEIDKNIKTLLEITKKIKIELKIKILDYS